MRRTIGATAGLTRTLEVGSALARFEARLAIEAIADRWPNLRLITEAPVKDPNRHDRYREVIVALD